VKHITNQIIIVLFLIISVIPGCKDNNVEPETPPPSQNPNSPVLLSPANGTLIVSLSPVLDWENFENAVSYKVQVSLDANFNGTMIIDSTITASTVTIPQVNVLTGIFFYWRVIANLQGNNVSNWSAIWKFMIRLNPPAPPVLVSPANGAINISFLPFFDWNSSPSAEFYRIQIADNAAFIPLLIDSNRITATEYQCIPGFLITGRQYFWRVNASNSNGLSTSDWSFTFNFTTVQGPVPSSISGRVTFVDTNFVALPTYYIVGAYTAWPPGINFPERYVQVVVQHQGNLHFADYTIFNLTNNTFKMALSALDASNNFTLGIYGCDTIHIPYSNCPLNPDTVSIQNYNGLENVNFLSWADTTMRIY